MISESKNEGEKKMNRVFPNNLLKEEWGKKGAQKDKGKKNKIEEQ